MTKYLLPLLVVSSIAIAEEVSVYGNSNSNSSYGLNSSEKHIIKNQAKIGELTSSVGDLKTLLNSINRRLEGLESTYEGDSVKINSTSKKVDDLISRYNSSLDVDSNSASSNASGDTELSTTVNNLKTAVAKLSTLINKINSEYVSSNELQKNMQQFITREEFEALKKSMGVKTSAVTPTKTTDKKGANIATVTTDPNSDFGELKTAEDRAKLLDSAKKDFQAKNYNGAILKYEKLVELNYKPAEGNFYLGEMWYIRKKYDQAIGHFKKSAMLNDKAAYMPSLLLHSAISFENTKDKENAKNFYSTLVDLYPTSSEAKEAKSKLSKL